MRAEHTHAVRAAERDTALVTDPFDPRLQLPSTLAALGKPSTINDGTLDPTFRCRGEWVEDALVAHAKDRNIGGLRQFCDAAVASAAQYGRIIRVDRKDRPGKPDPVQRGDQPAS